MIVWNRTQKRDPWGGSASVRGLKLLRRHVVQARQILRKLIVGRLTFTPREEPGANCSEFAGVGTLGNLVTGQRFH